MRRKLIEYQKDVSPAEANVKLSAPSCVTPAAECIAFAAHDVGSPGHNCNVLRSVHDGRQNWYFLTARTSIMFSTDRDQILIMMWV